MCFVQLPFIEAFSTHCAVHSILASMNRQVILQTYFIRVRLVAKVAIKSFSFVFPHMSLVISVIIKTFSTDFAVETELSCV